MNPPLRRRPRVDMPDERAKPIVPSEKGHLFKRPDFRSGQQRGRRETKETFQYRKRK